LEFLTNRARVETRFVIELILRARLYEILVNALARASLLALLEHALSAQANYYALRNFEARVRRTFSKREREGGK
jgi:hypothetical protein